MNPKWLLLLALLAIPLAWSWDRDLIPVNKGFGWDGQMYGMYTQFLPHAFEQKAINSHRIQRILVPAVLYHMLSALDIPRTEANVVEAYRFANMFFLLLGALAFLALARAEGWHFHSTVLGFGALFLSVPVLKMSLFYPLLPDLPAMAFGLAALYFWRIGWWWAMLPVLLAGSFTGPTMLAYGLLLAFPAGYPPKTAKAPWWVWGLLPLVFLAFWVRTWLHAPDAFMQPPSGSQPVRMALLPLSLPLALAWMAGLSALLYPTLRTPEWWKRIHWGWWAALGLLALAVRGLIAWGAGSEAPPQTPLSYLEGLMVQSVTWPGAFLLAHFQYLPGLVLLGVLTAPFLRRTLNELGLGAILLTIGLGVLLLGSETRQVLQLLPWAAFLFTRALDRHLRVPAGFIALWLVALSVAARWWEKLGNHPLEEGFLVEPAQRYFRLHGPWMNESTWLSTLAFFLVSSGILLLLWKKDIIAPRNYEDISDTKTT